MSEPLNVNVGVMGHVDSGKTTLVKAMSTTLSTAALDKHPQSQARGMTIDLGFSSFTAPVPTKLKDECQRLNLATDFLQLTLVDCPGHASLIRTIIGGAQIIDIMLLVVDCQKGIQAQTAECLVIGEITTERMVIALNKIDLIPESERESRCEAIERKIRRQLHLSKFYENCNIIRTAACPGGEKNAAHQRSSTGTKVESMGIKELVMALANVQNIPQRDANAPFFFSIDHCFPIKGQGTVVTGTCLRGTSTVGDNVELPALAIEKKIKSIQKFRKPAKKITAGDRAGLCLAQLDSGLVERGVLAAPGSVPFIWAAVARIRRIRFFKGVCRTESKLHITVGHTTCIATAYFFGADGTICTDLFEPGQQFPYQEELMPRPHADINELEPDICTEQFVLLRFEDVKVHCQTDAMVIGSRLSETSDSAGGCRLVFHGRLVYFVEAREKKELADIVQLYKIKQKTCAILKVESPSSEKNGHHYEALASGLFSSSAPMRQFVGLKVQANTGEIGTIASAYGPNDKFKVSFKTGTMVRPGPEALYLRYKRYIFRPNKTMYQDEDCYFKDPPVKPENLLINTPSRKNKKIGMKGEKKTDKDKLEISIVQQKKKPAAENRSQPIASVLPSTNPIRHGRLERIKGDRLENGRAAAVIAEGFFVAEEDQRPYIGDVVRGQNGDTGKLVGPFGKAGKSKVDFSQEGGTTLEAGATLSLFLSDKDYSGANK